MWAEIRNNYYNEEEGKVYIDAWETANDNEEGEVIAKVDVYTKEVEYLSDEAKTDDYAQEVIDDVLSDIDQGVYDEMEK